MAIIRAKKNKNYTTMSNFHLRDGRLSLKAKGLMSIILSLPDNWNYSIEGLVSICKENKTAVNNALKELKDCGYVKVDKIMPDKTKSKKIEYIYTIFEKPQVKNNEKQDTTNQDIDNQDIDNQDIGFLYLENLALENQPQSNTKESNTKELNTKNKKESVKEKTLKRFSPPTLEEVRAYCLEKNIKVDPERFIDHYTSNGWKVGRNPMKDWKAAVRNWGRSDFEHKKQATTEPESKYREMDDLDLAYIRAVEDLNRSLGGGGKNG